jgi:hypothetical protein
MIDKVARILLIIALLVATQEAVACSCMRRPLSELYSDSDDIYVGEVTSVRLVTKSPKHNEQATYEVELRPLLLLKGRAPESMKLTYSTTYHDPSVLLAAADDELVEYKITSCDAGYSVGTTFLFLLKRQEPLASIGMCTQRAFERPQPALIRAVRELMP